MAMIEVNSMELVRFTTNRSIEDGLEIARQRISDSLYIFKNYKHSFIERECPCCGDDRSEEYDRFHDTYVIAKCLICGTLFINPCPGPDALSDYYSNCISNTLNYQIGEKRKNKTRSSHMYDDRIRLLSNIADQLSEQTIRLLEIGSGPGILLEKIRSELSEKGMDLSGIDIDKNAVKLAQGKGFNVLHGNIEDLIQKQSAQFHVILHFELMEHLLYPRKFLEHCYRLLSNGGFMLFSTPNGEGLDNRAMGYNFQNRMMAHSIFPPMHLNCYNTRNITYLLLNLGFRICQIATPGKLDVDMLNVHDLSNISAAYKFISQFSEDKQALIQGLISDLNASSHMVVLAMRF